ncbi:MAG: dethiobiotin synthase [Gammaproteobacteria bacterium]
MSYKGLFITGTDTGVGKTYIGSQIVKQLDEMGVSVLPRKPIESGCQLSDGELQPGDAQDYFVAIKGKFALAEICPYRFEPAISPQRAARLVNQAVHTLELQQACLRNVSEHNFLVVEGAGGFYSPLCEDGLNADLAKALQLPILLIANDQLGCINHIMLTAEAIKQKGLNLIAVILNRKDSTYDDASMNNSEDLKSYLNVPIFSIGHDETIESNSPLINYLSEFKQ